MQERLKASKNHAAKEKSSKNSAFSSSRASSFNLGSQGDLKNPNTNFFSNLNQISILTYILIAYAFSLLCRFYWVVWASSFEPFYFNGELMINSNDGYAFAEGARDMIAGFHQPNDLSYFDSPLSALTYYIYELTPFSFESIILYMSAFFSSLIVLPLVLIGSLYQQKFMGFLAALFASIAVSYYNRTMIGYYDTDMLVTVLPCFFVYFLMRLIIKKDFLSLIALPLLMSFYLWYYPSSYTLNVALMGLFLLYTLVFHRKDKLFFMALIFMIIALSPIAWYYELALLALLFALFVFKNDFFKPVLLGILGALALILLFLSGGLEPILYQLQFYIFKSDASADFSKGFVYFNVSKTIQEASQIDISTFARRISSSELAFIFSIAGLLLLFKRHKSMILFLPLLALGFLALFGGLRFTIYAVPAMALGLAYFCVFIGEKILNFNAFKELSLYTATSLILALLALAFFALFLSELTFEFFVLFAGGFFALLLLKFRLLKAACFVAIFSLSFLSLGFALAHIYDYKASTVLTNAEVKSLDKLKSIAKPEDYAITWWDYGYALRYYSDVKTLVDGGKHLGRDNFFPSFVLVNDENSSANMARLSVEYTEKSFSKPPGKEGGDLLKAMMKDYNQSNEFLFFESLKDKNFIIKEPKTRDVYLYMPARMAAIFSTVASFSKIDLSTGELNQPFIFSTALALASEPQIALSNGFLIENDFKSLLIGDRKLAINSIYEISSVEKGEFKSIVLDKNAKYFVFILKENFVYPMQFIIMDKSMFQSAFVQMFFLNRFDKDLFELVINDKHGKVFRLKK